MTVRMALCFAHTPSYPDDPPRLSMRSLQGVKPHDLAQVQQQLEQEAQDSRGMAMMYTLASSAKEWLREHYGQVEDGDEEEEEVEVVKEEVVEAHGLPVNVDTFLEWRDSYEAELALEQAKLMPEAALVAGKEKRMTGRQWFESGAHLQKGPGRAGVMVDDEEEDEEEEIGFDDDFDDEDLDEEDMLDHFLAEKEKA
eukprot:jgi/Mesen1/7206/ME000371S06299